MAANPFSQILKTKNPGDITRLEEEAWEHSRVRHAMKKLGLNKNDERTVVKECEQFCGSPQLRFDVFCDHFSSFPFILTTNRLRGLPLPYGKKQTPKNYQVHTDQHSFEPERYKKFDWVPFVIAYRDFKEKVGESDRSIGLVFPRRGFQQGMIIHNDYSEQYWTTDSCWVHKDSDGEKLFVQPFDALLIGIKKARWHPG